MTTIQEAGVKGAKCLESAFSPDGTQIDPACLIVEGEPVEGSNKFRFSVEVETDIMPAASSAK